MHLIHKQESRSYQNVFNFIFSVPASLKEVESYFKSLYVVEMLRSIGLFSCDRCYIRKILKVGQNIV